jgi:hypothetical protein
MQVKADAGSKQLWRAWHVLHGLLKVVRKFLPRSSKYSMTDYYMILFVKS